MTAQIYRLDVIRAHRALLKYIRPDSSVADTLYGPAPLGLSKAEIDALDAAGFADVRKQRENNVYKVTLTPMGRRERERKKESRKAR